MFLSMCFFYEHLFGATLACVVWLVGFFFFFFATFVGIVCFFNLVCYMVEIHVHLLTLVFKKVNVFFFFYALFAVCWVIAREECQKRNAIQ